MVAHLRARGIRVIVYDPDKIPADFYQWDHIHFNAAAHAKIAASLAAQIAVPAKPQTPRRHRHGAWHSRPSATPARPLPRPSHSVLRAILSADFVQAGIKHDGGGGSRARQT